MKRDPVVELEKMLQARRNKLAWLTSQQASAAAIEDTESWIEALRQELELARAGQLPSALDALRGNCSRPPGMGSLNPLHPTPAMANHVMVSPEEAAALGLPNTLVEESVLLAARGATDGQALVDAFLSEALIVDAGAPDFPPVESEAQAAAAADAVLSEDGPQEPQEAASVEAEVEVEAGVAKKPRRARRPAPGVDAGQFIPDDPATPDVNEAYEPAES